MCAAAPLEPLAAAAVRASPCNARCCTAGCVAGGQAQQPRLLIIKRGKPARQSSSTLVVGADARPPCSATYSVGTSSDTATCAFWGDLLRGWTAAPTPTKYGALPGGGGVCVCGGGVCVVVVVVVWVGGWVGGCGCVGGCVGVGGGWGGGLRQAISESWAAPLQLQPYPLFHHQPPFDIVL